MAKFSPWRFSPPSLSTFYLANQFPNTQIPSKVPNSGDFAVFSCYPYTHIAFKDLSHLLERFPATVTQLSAFRPLYENAMTTSMKQKDQQTTVTKTGTSHWGLEDQPG